MANCKLSIEVHGADEHGDAWIEPGGTVDATVHVSVTGNGTVECSQLTLAREWRTHGRGNTEKGGGRTWRIFSGQWTEGEYAYTTTIDIGRRPVSYHGDNLNVDWMLMARADVPWAIDPKAEATVLVVDSTKPAPYEPPPRSPVDTVRMRGTFTGALIPALIGLVGAAVAIGFDWFRIVAIGVAAVTFVLALLSLRDRRTARRLGIVGFGIWPRDASPGSELHAFVELEPEEDLSIEAFHVAVVATETTISGSGTSETTHTSVVEELRHDVARDQRISAARRIHDEATFTLPLDVPTSFELDEHSLTWEVCLTIDLRGGSKLTHEVPIEVGGRD